MTILRLRKTSLPSRFDVSLLLLRDKNSSAEFVKQSLRMLKLVENMRIMFALKLTSEKVR